MYLRAVKRSAWVGFARGSTDSLPEAIADLVGRSPLVSVYVCGTCADAELVAVALSVGRSAQPFHYLAISASELAAEQVPVLRFAGRTRLPDANRLHRDLDLDGGRAQRLVARLAERRIAVGVLRERELRASARRLAAAGQPIPAHSWLLR